MEQNERIKTHDWSFVRRLSYGSVNKSVYSVKKYGLNMLGIAPLSLLYKCYDTFVDLKLRSINSLFR